MPTQFHIDQAIYYFNGEEPFTIGNACEGVQIFGGIGSGKTSGSGEALARAFLQSGFGGLVLCAKKDVMDDWKRYAVETGRSEQLLIFDGSGDFVFPFLQYEVEREGEGAGYTDNLVRLFTTVYEAVNNSSKGEGYTSRGKMFRNRSRASSWQTPRRVSEGIRTLDRFKRYYSHNCLTNTFSRPKYQCCDSISALSVA